MSKKILSILLLLLPALAVPAAWGQSAAPNARSAAPLAAGDNAWTNNNRFCGPIPWADVSCFGAHAPAGGVPSTTAICVKGNKQVVIAAPNTFAVDDGVTIYGCGATNNLETPSGLKVTPSEPWGLADTRSAVNGAEGKSTYTYTIVARDVYGALTAPAVPVSISNGQASLGLQRAGIKALSRSNDRITVVTTEPNRLVLGALVEIEPKDSQQFAGWYNVAKIDSSTEFELWTTPTDTRAQGWMAGDTVSYSGGGSVAYYQENFLKWAPLKGAWEYYVCAQRPGEPALKLIGVTKPTGLRNGYTDAAFEDYGSPYMDKQVFPSYVTDAICTGSATNDPLTTWVTAIAPDGVTLTLRDAPSQTAGRKTIIFDDAPGILRALNSIAYFHSEHAETNSYLGGAIYIPPALHPYVINSYLPVPNQVSIWQSGKLTLNETVSLSANDNWFGDWSSQGNPQFGEGSGASVGVYAASPGLYLMGTGNSFRALNILSQTPNGALLLVADNATPSNFDSVQFGTGSGATDYLGMDVVLRDSSSTIADYHFNKVSILSGPDQVNDKSWSPSFWVAPGQNHLNNGIEVTMENTYVNRRGIGWGGGHGGDAGWGGVTSFVSNWSYRQGGIIPYFTCMRCNQYSPITFNDASQDTEGQPLEAALIDNPNSGYPGPRISAHNPTGGVQAPLFSGLRPSFAEFDGIFSKASAIPNRDFLFKTGGSFTLVNAPYATLGDFSSRFGPLYTVGVPMHGVGGYSWWFDLAVPTQVSAKADAGGGVPAGTWVYAVSAVGADGGETILSAASPPVTISNGTQTVRLKWNASLGAYSYNVWRCNTANPCISPEGTILSGFGLWLRVALHTAGTAYTDTSASPARFIPPEVTGTGSTIVNASGAYAPFFQAPPISVSQLPAAAPGNAGEMRRVSDSSTITTEGQKCEGNGSATALAFSNGQAWKCF